MSSEMLYQQIRNYLLQLIHDNHNQPDHRLPSENQLCIKFHASRVSVQRAMRMLEEEGAIYRQQGRGTFIRREHTDPVLSPSPTGNDKKQFVGMLVPELDSLFIQQIISSVQSILLTRNYTVALFCTYESARLEEQFIRTSLDMGAKGLIIMPVSFNQYSNEMLRLALNKFPTVQLDRYLPGLPMSCVSGDHFNSIYNATTLLQSQGHKIIGLVTQPSSYCSSVSTRINGYERAMMEADILYNNRVHFIRNAEDPDFENAFEEYLDSVKPTALISSSRYYGPHISHVFSRKGISLMKDITFAIYDNEYQDTVAYNDVMPIIIDQRPIEIGRSTAEELLRQINGETPKGEILISEIIHPSRPIVR